MSLGVLNRVVGPLNLRFTVDGATLGATGTITINNGGYNYVVGDVIDRSDITGTGLPTGVKFTVATVSSTGVITSLTIKTAGSAGATGTVTGIRASSTGTEAGYGTGYINHDLSEAGGNISEYPYGIGGANKTSPPDPADAAYLRPTGLNIASSNIPTVTVERPADRPQLKVEGRVVTSGGVTVTVFSEPTIVNGYGAYNGNGYQYITGTVVGNTVRAEDINDQDRCTALGFTWESVTKTTGNRESYSYCREITAADMLGKATADADCPAGYKYSASNGGSCIKQTLSDVNNSTYTKFTQAENAVGAGYIYNYVTSAYINPTDSATPFQTNIITALLPGTTGTADSMIPMGKVELAKSLCRTYGFVWNKTSGKCESDNSTYYVKGNYDGSDYKAKQACVEAGYVWLAGACMNPNLFGDGQGRQTNQATSIKLVTPK